MSSRRDTNCHFKRIRRLDASLDARTQLRACCDVASDCGFVIYSGSVRPWLRRRFVTSSVRPLGCVDDVRGGCRQRAASGGATSVWRAGVLRSRSVCGVVVVVVVLFGSTAVVSDRSVMKP